MKRYVMAVCASAFLVSCGSIGTAVNTSNQPSLVDTKWQLAENVKGKVPTLNVQTGKIAGNGGCNNYFGELMTDAATGSFSASNIGSTKMACASMTAESAFFSMLPKANKYRVSGNTLELYQNSLLLLKFNRIQ